MVWFKLLNAFGKQHDRASQEPLIRTTQKFHSGVLAKENNRKSLSVTHAKMFHITLFIRANLERALMIRVTVSRSHVD